MSTSVPIIEISKIPHIDSKNLYGRTISSLSFFIDGKWELWLPTPEGLIKTRAIPAEGGYFAIEPEKETDIYFHFMDFIAQRACWPSVAACHRGLTEDFFNLAASIKKFDILFSHSAELRIGTSRLVTTELEYLFGLCRSIFDLLQEMISAQWDYVRLNDQSLKKRQLPKKFSDIVLSGNALRSRDEITQRFFIPVQLVDFYLRAGRFFQILRVYRDRYVHGGTTPEFVYVTDQGFAVYKSREPFSGFGVWRDADMLPNELCSLRPAIAYLAIETLRVCEDYAATMQSIVEYPPPIAPNLRFFMRGHFNESLIRIRDSLDGNPWWKIG